MMPKIVISAERKLIGKRKRMSFSNNTTAGLWKSFIPDRHLIKNSINSDLISMQIYESNFNFSNFNPDLEFDKWAAVEVSDFSAIPKGMETYTIPRGKYAVFIHKGGPVKGPETFGYIFGSWIPQSEYEIDNRPQFEILGKKYKNNEPDSEEEIWIPIKGSKSQTH